MSDKQKRSKAHYVTNNKKRKVARGRMPLGELKKSTKGVMATANFLGPGCKREVMWLIKEYCGYNKDVVRPSAEDEGADVDDEIAKEIEELKKDKKKLREVDTTLNNLMYITVDDDSVDVCEMVHRMLSTLHEKKERRTRFTQRILPVSHTCYADIEDMKRTAKLMVQGQLYTKVHKTWGINFKKRNNSTINRDDVIKSIASVATDDDTYLEFNKVDLDKSEFTIMINVVKNIAFMGLLRDFHLLSKYNCDELTKGFSNPFKRRNEEKDNDKNKDKSKESADDVNTTNHQTEAAEDCVKDSEVEDKQTEIKTSEEPQIVEQ